MKPKIDLELSRIKLFLEAIGNPQEKIKYKIQIAGTNGKGSTLAFLENLLQRNTNLKIGKYTSPHLVSIRERFQISQGADTEKISFFKLRELFLRFSRPSFTYSGDFRSLTPFEKLTVIAFVYFSEEAVDLVLLETGLGGRLDATNVIRNTDLCLFTNISFDHTEYLGDTKEKIAQEKAGILKPASFWISSVDSQENLIIRQIAQRKGAREIKLKNLDLNSEQLALPGKYQIKNAQLALNAFDFLVKNKLDRKELKDNSRECKKINWPGRFQEITEELFPQAETGKIKVILDGAHNQDSARKLRESLDQEFSNYKEIFLVSFSRKDFLKQRNILKELVKINSTELIVTELNSSKKIFNQERLKQEFEFTYIPNFERAFQEFKTKILAEREETVGLITGSLYLVGKVLSGFQTSMNQDSDCFTL